MHNFENKNEEIASSMMYYEKTIALLRGNAAEDEMNRLKKLLRDSGWYVYEISDEDFCKKGGHEIGSITVICDGKSVPEDMQDSLERYLTQNGRLFFFGGPLFGNQDITKKTMLFEGVSPLYKTFTEEECEEFFLWPQAVSDTKLTGKAPYVICPDARPDGGGFAKGRHCRMLPIVSVQRKEGRDKGRRGCAAFFVLSDTLGRMPNTHGTRLGNVSPLTRGSISAVIGTPLKHVLNMHGEKLITDMMSALDRGIFLFEAGTKNYVLKPGEKIAVGAQIFSAARDFKEVTVRFWINGIEKEETVLAAGQNFTTVSGEYEALEKGVYKICVELLWKENVIDSIESELIIADDRCSADAADFVSVSKDKFRLHNQNWNMYGINYWPSYQISMEVNDYWRGIFDKSNYIQTEVDKDLAHIRELGMNAVAVRIESNSFENIIDSLKDFLYRCDKYGLKVMISFCNITNPLYFDECAWRQFVELAGISRDPVIMAYDIFWESGGSFFNKTYTRRFAREWEEWLIEQYGSIENAEKSFGMPIDRTEFGDIVCPSREEYIDGNPRNRIRLTTFTRFMTNLASRKWNKVIAVMKKYDEHHLYTNRIGLLEAENVPNVFLSALAKHFDFVCLEAYSFTRDKYGYLASIAYDSAARYVSGGKPITWVEYGISLVGMSGVAVGTKLLWDGIHNRPTVERLEEQRLYQEQFNRMLQITRASGTMPWFYAGGFRFTEHSDCGYVAPGGKNRPAMDEYVKVAKWFRGNIPERKITEKVMVDPEGTLGNWYPFVYGKGVFSKFAFDRMELLGENFSDNRIPGPGILAAERAQKHMAVFDFITPGDGTTSINTPLILCGGEEYQGWGPLKYLDGEFNHISLSNEDTTILIHNGDCIRLLPGEYNIHISAGNLAAACWRRGNGQGCVAARFGTEVIPLKNDVAYLEDGELRGMVRIKESGMISVRLTAIGRADFGELISFRAEVG